MDYDEWSGGTEQLQQFQLQLIEQHLGTTPTILRLGLTRNSRPGLPPHSDSVECIATILGALIFQLSCHRSEFLVTSSQLAVTSYQYHVPSWMLRIYAPSPGRQG